VSTAQHVIDEIGALVDEQLQQEASGYDHNLNQPRCRCGAGWHGMKLGGCPGSDTEGPPDALRLTFGNWQDVRQDIEPLIAAFRGIADEVSRAWESLRDGVAAMAVTFPTSNAPPSRCTLAARRRMHSDQLRVQRRAVRRERRARRREATRDPLEVHDDYVILTLIPDVSGFRRELRRISE